MPQLSSTIFLPLFLLLLLTALLLPFTAELLLLALLGYPNRRRPRVATRGLVMGSPEPHILSLGKGKGSCPPRSCSFTFTYPSRAAGRRGFASRRPIRPASPKAGKPSLAELALRRASGLSWAQQFSYYETRFRIRRLLWSYLGPRWGFESEYELCRRLLEALILWLIRLGWKNPDLPHLLQAVQGQTPPGDGLVFVASRLLEKMDEWAELLFPYAALVLLCPGGQEGSPDDQAQRVLEEQLNLMEELGAMLGLLKGLQPLLKQHHWERWDRLEAERQRRASASDSWDWPEVFGPRVQHFRVLLRLWWFAPDHQKRLARWPGLPKLVALLRRLVHRRLEKRTCWPQEKRFRLAGRLLPRRTDNQASTV